MKDSKSKTVFVWVAEIFLELIVICALFGLVSGVFGVLVNFTCCCLGWPQLQMSFKGALSVIGIIVLCVMIVRIVNAIVDYILG